MGGDVCEDKDVVAAIDGAQSLGTLSIVVNVAGDGVRGAGRIVTRDGVPHDKDAFVATMAMKTGIEGRISCLKRDYGWARTHLDGLNGARTWCAWGVLCHNSVRGRASPPHGE